MPVFDVELELRVEFVIPVGDALSEVPISVGVMVVNTPLFSTDTIGLPVIVDAAKEVADDRPEVEVGGTVGDDEDNVAVPKDQSDCESNRESGNDVLDAVADVPEVEDVSCRGIRTAFENDGAIKATSTRRFGQQCITYLQWTRNETAK